MNLRAIENSLRKKIKKEPDWVRCNIPTSTKSSNTLSILKKKIESYAYTYDEDIAIMSPSPLYNKLFKNLKCYGDLLFLYDIEPQISTKISSNVDFKYNQEYETTLVSKIKPNTYIFSYEVPNLNMHKHILSECKYVQGYYTSPPWTINYES